jgi:hypothetical protein
VASSRPGARLPVGFSAACAGGRPTPELAANVAPAEATIDRATNARRFISEDMAYPFRFVIPLRHDAKADSILIVSQQTGIPICREPGTDRGSFGHISYHGVPPARLAPQRVVGVRPHVQLTSGVDVSAPVPAFSRNLDLIGRGDGPFRPESSRRPESDKGYGVSGTIEPAGRGMAQARAARLGFGSFLDVSQDTYGLMGEPLEWRCRTKHGKRWTVQRSPVRPLLDVPSRRRL